MKEKTLPAIYILTKERPDFKGEFCKEILLYCFCGKMRYNEENAKRGEDMPVVRSYERQTGRDAMYNVWHCGDTAELLWVHSGEGSIVFQSGVYPLRTGRLYYIGAGVLHYTLPGDGCEYSRSKLFFTDEALQADAQIKAFLAGRGAVCAVPDAAQRRQVQQLFDQLLRQQPAQPFAGALALGALVQLLAILCAAATDAVDAPQDPVAGAAAYINSHLESPLTLDELCAVTGTSRSGLCHRFRRQMGMTLTEYIRRTRLELAAQLLRSCPQLSIAAVAERCGFGDTAWFCSVFRRHTGLSPGKYRRE